MSDDNSQLNQREKVTITILLFIIRMINPTGYQHEITQLKDAIESDLSEAEEILNV